MKKNKMVFICGECGYQAVKWFGQCPSCGAWDSMVEHKKESSSNKLEIEAAPSPLSFPQVDEEGIIDTGIYELNRVLGGGIVKGSVILIGGPPGTGKSTLLLQTAHSIASSGKKVLYISGEESLHQIQKRAARTQTLHQNILLLCETNFLAAEKALKEQLPDLVILDSVQTLKILEAPGYSGSPVQIREIAGRVLELSKTLNIPSFIVGHITKEGLIAGPKILEHMVDVVLYFEISKDESLRILRAVKNRFGAVNEIGIFSMTPQGMVEVGESVNLFTTQEGEYPGKALTCVREGTRDFIVEVQSLVRPLSYGYGRRVITGLDTNRVLQIMAVLESAGGPDLRNADVYTATVRGIRVQDTSADLAVAASLLSSTVNKSISSESLFLGEVTLTGQVVGTFLLKERILGAVRMGFKKLFVPRNFDEKIKECEITIIENVKSLIKLFK